MTAPTIGTPVGNKSSAKDGVDLITSTTVSAGTRLLVFQVSGDAASATIAAPTCTVDTGSGPAAGPAFSAVGGPIVPVTGSGKPVINLWAADFPTAGTAAVTTDTATGRVGAALIVPCGPMSALGVRTPTPQYVNTTAGAPASSQYVTAAAPPSATVTTTRPDSVVLWLSYDEKFSSTAPTYRSGATERYKAQNVGPYEMSVYWATQPTSSTPGDQTIGMIGPSQTYVLAAVEISTPPPNNAPTANAGSAQTVQPYETVTLTGSGTDTDGTIASYTWTQTAGPAVTLSGSGATRTFTAPGVLGGTSLTFSLTVTDNAGATSTASTVTITVGEPNYYVAGPSGWTGVEVRTL